MTPAPRLAMGLCGVALIAIGLFMPTACQDALPPAWDDLPPPPIDGVSLLRVCLALEGCLLSVLALTMVGVRLRRPWVGPWKPVAQDSSSSMWPYAIGIVVVVGAFLRMYRLGTELWLDEITTTLELAPLPTMQIVTSFQSTNNQLLNTLLVKAMIMAFGAEEWAVRLPAALFGIASLPALYRLARLVLGRYQAVMSTAILAFSYHHIFFSQNARGYTAYLLFSLLGTYWFLRGVAEGKPVLWASYVASMFLATASILIGLFVVAGHVLTLMAAVIVWHRRGVPVAPVLRRALLAWVVLGALLLDLYATVIPQIWVTLGGVYRGGAAGYAVVSSEYLRELLRGISAGFGGGVATAIITLAVLSGAWIVALKRHTFYTSTLTMPLAVSYIAFAAAGLQLSPRFFLWSVPVAAILLVVAQDGFAGRLLPGRPAAVAAMTAGVVVAVLTVSIVMLPTYYATPKQPSAAAVRWVQDHAEPGDVVATAYLAKWAFRYYGPRHGMEEGAGFHVVGNLGDLQRLERDQPSATIWVVSTFPRALQMEFPALQRHIEDTYDFAGRLEASVGDGDFTFWRRKQTMAKVARTSPPRTSDSGH